MCTSAERIPTHAEGLQGVHSPRERDRPGDCRRHRRRVHRPGHLLHRQRRSAVGRPCWRGRRQGVRHSEDPAGWRSVPRFQRGALVGHQLPHRRGRGVFRDHRAVQEAQGTRQQGRGIRNRADGSHRDPRPSCAVQWRAGDRQARHRNPAPTTGRDYRTTSRLPQRTKQPPAFGRGLFCMSSRELCSCPMARRRW